MYILRVYVPLEIRQGLLFRRHVTAPLTVWDHVISLYSLSLICIVEIPLLLQQTTQSKYVFIRLLTMFWA